MANKYNRPVFNGVLLKDFASVVQKALNQDLGTENPFLAKNMGDNIVFEEPQNKTGTLKKVTITQIPVTQSEEYIWFMDKWDEPATAVLKDFGLKNQHKAVDGIIFTFLNNELIVYMIELKSSMNDANIKECYHKFVQTIGKLALYICLNAWEHRQMIIFQTAKIKFKGVIFYNGGNNNVDKDSTESIFKVFHKPNQTGKVICETFLGKDDIDVKFISKPNKEEIEVTFQEFTMF